jgi:alginate O-acetyltransferase complex protein AlgI
MLFNSVAFLIFAAVFFAGWPLLKKRNTTRWIYLVAASFFFYGWWDWRFLLLILFSGFIDYFAALAMVRWPSRRKALLVASIFGNIGSLAVFKYLDFFVGNLNWAMGFLGTETSIRPPNLILPVGISFYTFQSMSYTIDVFRRRLEPTRNVFHFFAYLSMFPQLVAGPIIRAAHLLPQLKHMMPSTEKQRWEGTELVVYGFFKKVVVADTIGPIVDAAFKMETPMLSSGFWWAIMIMFAFQIYCDFSGYSDIARGLAKWMGYDFGVNFDHPYGSTSMRRFWERWHISLSSWFRDYLYIPLGGSRGSSFLGHRNMWIVMLIAGLWHGAAWTFICWGAIHAFYLSVERLTNWPKKLGLLPGGRGACAVLIFVLVLISWVFFRAQSFGQAGIILTRLFDFTQMGLSFSDVRSVLTIKALALTALMAARQVYIHLDLHKPRLAVATQPVVVGLLIVACVFFRGPGAAFIYFQF